MSGVLDMGIGTGHNSYIDGMFTVCTDNQPGHTQTRKLINCAHP